MATRNATIVKTQISNGVLIQDIPTIISAFSIITDSEHRFVTDIQLSKIDLFIGTGSITSQSLSDYYTKSSSDSRYKPIAYIPAWNDINGKPTQFPPVSHQHTINDIQDLSGSFYNKSESDGNYKLLTYIPSWSELSGKPTSFTASIHSHSIVDIIGLNTLLLSKVDVTGSKVLSDNNYTSAEKNKLAAITVGASGSYTQQKSSFTLTGVTNQTFTHNFNSIPSAYTIYDSNGREIRVLVTFSPTTIKVESNQPVTGILTCIS